MTLSGGFSGKTATMPETNTYLLSGYRATRRYPFPPTEKTARCVPLLVTPDGRPAASLFHHLAGPYAGGLWACFGVTNRDLFPSSDEAMGDAFVTLVDRMLGTASLVDIKPRFIADSDGVWMEGFATVANHGLVRQELDIHTSLVPAAGGGAWREESVSIRLCGGVSKEILLLRAKADAFDWKDFSVVCRLRNAGKTTCGAGVPPAQCSRDGRTTNAEAISPAFLRADGQTIDTIKTSVDVRAALLAVCDRFVQRQRSRGDGKIHGYGFVDNRGARAQLAAYELFDRQEYLDAAVRWGEAILAEQRDDGGYRMGYGYYAEGDECFVADGGEIACAVARLIAYVPNEDRERYSDSLKSYMAYRDSFRCEGGGIGVGWCKSDYGSRPIERLDNDCVEKDPQVLAALMPVTYHVCSAEALSGIPRILKKKELSPSEWLYLNFAAVSLPGLLEPEIIRKDVW